MSKRILLDSVGDNIIAALADDNKLLEYQLERKNKAVVAGSIYKGRVENIVGGMQAAFIDVGLQKNGYLYLGDCEVLYDKSVLEEGNIQLNMPELHVGDEVLVQAVKDPVGTKGVRLSTQLSFVGRLLVYMPYIDYIGVSRKIIDEGKRDKLTAYADSIKRPQGGFIVRTAAENATKAELSRDAKYLIEGFNDVMSAYADAAVPATLYEEGNLANRMLRDIDSRDVHEFLVADKDLYDYVMKAASKRAKDDIEKISFYSEKEDIFKHYGLIAEVDRLLRNRVDLPNGAYIIIDKTEALTVIDVNTGKFTGVDSLEETVFITNVAAAKEIARQVRLRNISGIVIVDFIDMHKEEHRNAILSVLTESLLTDRTKCNVIGMTGLGLVEFTRKKKRRESASMLVQPCPYCKGEGTIYSNEYVVMKIRTALLDLFAQDYASAIIDLNVHVAEALINSGLLKKDIEKIYKGKKLFIVPHKTYHHEFFIVKGDNSLTPDLPQNAVEIQ